MSINFSEKTGADGKPLGIAEINNGDLEALKEVMEQYGFVNQEALLRYAMVALINASDNRLYVKKDGNTLAVNVSPSLIKKPTEKSDN